MSAPEQPAAEEPTTEQPAAAQPAAEEPTAEKPAAEKHALTKPLDDLSDPVAYQLFKLFITGFGQSDFVI